MMCGVTVSKYYSTGAQRRHRAISEKGAGYTKPWHDPHNTGRAKAHASVKKKKNNMLMMMRRRRPCFQQRVQTVDTQSQTQFSFRIVLERTANFKHRTNHKRNRAIRTLKLIVTEQVLPVVFVIGQVRNTVEDLQVSRIVILQFFHICLNYF